MTSANEEARRLAELENLLDTWGGASTRWPPEIARRIEVLAGDGPRARAMLAEARALDSLLDRAEEISRVSSPAAGQALADRIVAAALTAVPPASSGRVIAMPTVRARPTPANPGTRSAPAFGSRWHAGGLMAASLLAGIYLGGSINLAPVVQELAEVVGLQAVVDPVLPQLGDDLGDEETP